MTEYKVGDEVLVRARVARKSDLDGDVCLKVTTKAGGIWVTYCDPSQIYSIAPEFDIGEEIELSDDKITWHKDAFLVEDCISNSYPYVAVSGLSWKYARKIKPKNEPVTAEELSDFITDAADNSLETAIAKAVEHFKGRRIG